MTEFGECSRPSRRCSYIFGAMLCLFLCSAAGGGFSVPLVAQEKPNRRATRQNQLAEQEKEKKQTLQNIPWEELSSDAQEKIRRVVSAHTLFRRMPQQKVYCDPEMFSFLVEHPDIVVGFWHQLGVTQVSLQQQSSPKQAGRHFVMKEASGTTAVAEILHRTSNLCVVYGRGQYCGPFLTKLYNGEVLLVMRSRFVRDANEEPMVICDLDAFVRTDNVGADLLAKLFATSLGKIADSNFEQTLAFVSHVCEAAATNPNSLRVKGLGLSGVREGVREEFCDVVDRVALRSAKYQARLFPEYYVFEPHPAAKRTFPEQRRHEMESIPWNDFTDMNPEGWVLAGVTQSDEELTQPKPLQRKDTAPSKPLPATQDTPSSVSQWKNSKTEHSVSIGTDKNVKFTEAKSAGTAVVTQEQPKGRVVFGTPRLAGDAKME